MLCHPERKQSKENLEATTDSLLDEFVSSMSVVLQIALKNPTPEQVLQ